jgi:hypothetical protein
MKPYRVRAGLAPALVVNRAASGKAAHVEVYNLVILQ